MTDSQVLDVANDLFAKINADSRKRFIDRAQDKKIAEAIWEENPSVRRPTDRAGRLPEKAIIRTGSESLDLAIGTGGLPRGHLIQVHGPYSSGKSHLALSAAAAATRNGEIVLYFDSEGSTEDLLMHRMGMDPSLIMIEREGTIESIVSGLINPKGYISQGRGKIGMIVIDSIPMTLSEKELEFAQSEDKAMMMAKAKAWTERLPALQAKCQEYGIVLLAVNQERDGGTYQNGTPKPPKLPGGQVWGFMPTLTIRVQPELDREDRKSAGGVEVHKTKFHITKNKTGGVGRQHAKGWVEFRPGHAYPRGRDVLLTAISEERYADYGHRVFLRDQKYDPKVGLSGSKDNYTLILSDPVRDALARDLQMVRGRVREEVAGLAEAEADLSRATDAKARAALAEEVSETNEVIDTLEGEVRKIELLLAEESGALRKAQESAAAARRNGSGVSEAEAGVDRIIAESDKPEYKSYFRRGTLVKALAHLPETIEAISEVMREGMNHIGSVFTDEEGRGVVDTGFEDGAVSRKPTDAYESEVSVEYEG